MKVVVITISGLHLGYLGCYGNDWVETPVLDRLASEGVVFDQHFADEPSAERARRALRTGCYGFATVIPSEARTFHRPDLFCILKEAGIESRLVTEPTPSSDAFSSLAKSERCLLWFDLDWLRPPWDVTADYLAAYFDDDTEEEEEPLEPLFDPPPVIAGPNYPILFRRLQTTYAALVTQMDERLGLLVKELENQALKEDLLLLITSDRGQPLGEHGVVGDARPWLHDELVHLPLILRFPGHAEAGLRIPTLTQSVDILPTLLDAFGVPIPELHGQSLLPLLRGEKDRLRDYAVAGLSVAGETEWAIRTPDWTYLLPQPLEARQRQLYVKPDDRWEVNNVVQHHPELGEQLEKTLLEFVAATRKPGPFRPPDLQIAPSNEKETPS